MSLSVSFGSTYKINQQYSQRNSGSIEILFEHCEDKRIPHDILYGDKLISATIVSPDNADKDIETMCARLGIDFKKYATEQLINPNAIMRHIIRPPIGKRVVKIDADEFEKLAAFQENNNIIHCENDYIRYYSPRTNFMLKSGNEIPATSVYINPVSGKDSMIEYIEHFGKDKINPSSIFIGFEQKTNDPDHCMYFAMKDAGMKEIPVYMDQDSYELANALGIVKR